MPVQAVLDFGSQLAEALASLHDAGQCFGALSPAAVLVSPDGKARLLEPQPDDAQPYLPPDAAASPAADQFAFGVMLAEMLTGLKPAPGALPSMETLRNYAPEALIELVSRLTAPTPAARFGSMHEVSEQLRQLKVNWHVPHVPKAVQGALLAFLILFGAIAAVVWYVHR